MNFTECANLLFRNNEKKKKRIFVSPSLFASLALLISETVSRAMIETKLPLLNSAVANLGEGPLFRVKIIAEGREAMETHSKIRSATSSYSSHCKRSK